MSVKTKTKRREMSGQFAPGNPFARKAAALRRAAADFATEDNVRTVLATMFLRAQQRDVAAARLWLAYTLGRPGESADPDTLEAHELRVRREAAEAREGLVATAESATAPGAPTPPPPGGRGRSVSDAAGRSASASGARPGAGEAPDPGHREAPYAARLSPFYRSSSGSAPTDAERPPMAATASATEGDGGRRAPSTNGKNGPTSARYTGDETPL